MKAYMESKNIDTDEDDDKYKNKKSNR